jgi:hypothetical protein
MARPAARSPLALALVFVSSVASAQEVLEDQDPIDPDWAPAWDTPFWPAPRGAALELAAGRSGSQMPVPLDGLGQSVAGDYVLALLTLPLGVQARPAAATDQDDAEQPTESEADESVEAPPSAAGEEASGPLRAEPAATARSESARSEEIPLSLLQDALDQADKTAGFTGSLRRLGAIGQRARWSGLAPELRLRGATGIDQTRSTDSAGLVPSDQTQRDGSDSLLEVRLTFHLERLLHAGQEVTIERARQDVIAQRLSVRSQVSKDLVIYVRARRRLQGDLPDEEAWEKVALALEQARLSLYLATGGWFRGEETVRRYEEPVPAPVGRGEPD